MYPQSTFRDIACECSESQVNSAVLTYTHDLRFETLLVTAQYNRLNEAVLTCTHNLGLETLLVITRYNRL